VGRFAHSYVMALTGTMTARLRETTFEDAEGIAPVFQRNGVAPMHALAWRQRWECYPFAAEFRDIPIGWVLETDSGSVAGTLGNVWMLYELAGRRLKAAIATEWAVDTEYRRQALQLMVAFYKQKGIDLWLNGSANQITARILSGMRIPRIPIPDYAVPCFWAVRPQPFVRAALLRKSIKGAALLSRPAGLVLHAMDILRRSGRGRSSSPVHRLRQFDERFDLMWSQLAAGPPRLRAVRTRAVLEWRFGAELRGNRAAIVVAERAAAPSGYAVLVRRETSGMDLYDVADLQAVGDDALTTRDLLLGSIKVAREDGVEAVKFLSGTPAKRLPANELRPHTYQLPLWQLYYKTTFPELGAALSSADAWDFSPFDTY